jgi:uncharacterized protein YxeA
MEFMVYALKMLLKVALNTIKSCQRGNQNPYVEERQTTQWRKEKGQKISTKHYTENFTRY